MVSASLALEAIWPSPRVPVRGAVQPRGTSVWSPTRCGETIGRGGNGGVDDCCDAFGLAIGMSCEG